MNINRDTSGVKCVFGSVHDRGLTFEKRTSRAFFSLHRLPHLDTSLKFSLKVVRPCFQRIFNIARHFRNSENPDEISELILLSGKP